MKFKLPAFLEGIEAPIDGEVAMRKFAAQAGENAVVVGIDEVGRGPLAGPVVACAAVLNSWRYLPLLLQRMSARLLQRFALPAATTALSSGARVRRVKTGRWTWVITLSS